MYGRQVEPCFHPEWQLTILPFQTTRPSAEPRASRNGRGQPFSCGAVTDIAFFWQMPLCTVTHYLANATPLNLYSISGLQPNDELMMRNISGRIRNSNLKSMEEQNRRRSLLTGSAGQLLSRATIGRVVIDDGIHLLLLASALLERITGSISMLIRTSLQPLLAATPSPPTLVGLIMEATAAPDPTLITPKRVLAAYQTAAKTPAGLDPASQRVLRALVSLVAISGR